jgi:ABC-type branched-subunit amino acid transport system substrate-binding protein
LVAGFAATLAGRTVHPQSAYAAQAAEIMLDAIAASDGSRSSVATALSRQRANPGIIGSFGFDPAGDVTSAPITIVRARRGGGSPAVVSTEGAQVVRVIAGASKSD